MDIRILPANIANMIAAGEVVQRPASVVKELVENAVDAGATQISVVIQDAGRTLIQVIDNGSGMSADEAVLCFERHATSKLATAEDLNNILTFGFRGEALASIAAVAEVTLKTRRAEDEVGCQVDFADSRHLSTIETATPVGSNFAVRNLFYNVPARRKFLKSDNVEFKHIVTEFTRVALTREDIAFTLIHNGKDVFVLRPAKSLKFRIQDILGTGLANEVVDVHADTTVLKLDGFVGRPDAARKGLGNQYFFVNGRFFKSPYLHKAVMKAYENLIPEGVTPSYVLYLQVNPNAVDVNIHPTKTEIKFEDDSVIFQIVYACIKETLGKNSFVDSIDFNREGVTDLPVFSDKYDEFRPITEPQLNIDRNYNPFDNDGFPSESSHFDNGFIPSSREAAAPSQIRTEDSGPSGRETHFHYPSGGAVEKHQDYGKLFEDKMAFSRSALIIKGKYIVTTSRSGLMFINVRRAMERILYERFINVLSKQEHLTQSALFPVTVRVGAENMCLFAEHSAMLESLGFDFSPFSADSIVVNGVPEGFSAEEGKVITMVEDLVRILSEDHSALKEMMAANMASSLARLGALSCDPVTDVAGAQRLIDSLFACENSEFTVSGRRIVNVMSVEDIDNRF